MFSMVLERIKAWQKNNAGKLPKAILFYRDGVSESQFKDCKEHEVPEIRKAYSLAGGESTDLKLTFVVVSKRHHTRFYATKKDDTYVSKVPNPEDRDGRPIDVSNGNLKPGLLVENVVTSPIDHNFFLQSHGAIKGTARSAHYHALIDEMLLGRDHLPQLTNMLCFAFGRATKGVSYVAPAYIADRLCDRGQVYLRFFKQDAPSEYRLPKKRKGEAAWTKDTINIWKNKKADEIAKTPGLWGNQAAGRSNPWHENLDGVMFWM